MVRIRTDVVLPAPFGPEEAVDLALGDGEVEPVDGADAALELAHEARDLDGWLTGRGHGDAAYGAVVLGGYPFWAVVRHPVVVT